MSKGTIIVAIILSVFAGILLLPSLGGSRADPQTVSAGILVFLSALLLVSYLMPTFVAFRRDHPNASAIAVVNILLGWTLIGWVVSLAWAVSAIRKPA